eukprot:2039517-Prymnesium_polylepis.1
MKYDRVVLSASTHRGLRARVLLSAHISHTIPVTTHSTVSLCRGFLLRVRVTAAQTGSLSGSCLWERWAQSAVTRPWHRVSALG